MGDQVARLAAGRVSCENMEPMETAGDKKEPPKDDAVAIRLAALLASLSQRLGESIAIGHEAIPGTTVEATRIHPRNPQSCSMGWLEMGGSEVIFEVGRGGGWEMTRTEESITKIERLALAVVDGKVSEVSAPGRCATTVILDDGSNERTKVAGAPRGCLPMPGSTLRGKRVRYAPYA